MGGEGTRAETGSREFAVEEATECQGAVPRQRVVSDLRETLVKLFGFIPEAWKKKVNPAITTQCPDPEFAAAHEGTELNLGRNGIYVNNQNRRTRPRILQR